MIRTGLGGSVATAIIVVAMVAATTATATSVLERSVAELFQRADQVIYGVVESRVTEAPTGGPRSTGESETGDAVAERRTGGATVVTIRVERFHPDDDAASPETVELRFGAAPDAPGAVSVVDDLPMPAVGDRVLVARYLDDELLSPVVGFWQGLWTVEAQGLIDLRGRVLGLAGDTVAIAAPDRDVTRVVAAIFRTLRGEGGRFDAGTAPGSAQAAQQAASIVVPAEPLRLAVETDAQVRAVLERAAAAWAAVGVPIAIEFDRSASDRVREGRLAQLGPDALAVTRRVPGHDGVELLVRAGTGGFRDDVASLLLGRLLGLPAGPAGLRSGLVPSEGRQVPTVEDGRRLRELLARALGDLDGSGVVDLYDLALLAEAYGTPGTRLPADLDDSGRVDDGDVDTLRSAYRFLPPARDPPPAWNPTDPAVVSDP